jgi:hypothetical protein
MKMIRRVERLEHAMGVSDDPPEPPVEIHVKYVARDGSVIDGYVVKGDPSIWPRGQARRGFTGRRLR